MAPTTTPDQPDRDADVRRFAAASLTGDDPTAWFEPLYAAAGAGEAVVPWDGGDANRYLIEWAERDGVQGAGRRAVVVGCGYGDDAEYVAGLGFDTEAFDVAPSAVEGARRRFPESTVRYRVADVLDPPDQWRRAFDLVVEIYTLQALPEPPRDRAAVNIADFVAPGGTLLVIAVRHDDRVPVAPPPWPLRRADLDAVASTGLRPVRVEELADVARWRAEFRRS